MVESKELIYSKDFKDIKFDLQKNLIKKSVFDFNNLRSLQKTNETDKNNNLNMTANNSTQTELKSKEDSKASLSEEFLKDKIDNNKENKTQEIIVNLNSQVNSSISENKLIKESGNSPTNKSENLNKKDQVSIKDIDKNKGENLTVNSKDSNRTQISENKEQNTTLITKENTNNNKIETDKKPENKENEVPKSELDKIAEAYKSNNKSDNTASNNKSDASSMKKDSLNNKGIEDKDQIQNQEKLQKNKDE